MDEKIFLKDSNHQLYQANSMVVLLRKIKIETSNIERIFALTFGRGKNLFKENIFEKQFGLKIILNSIKENELRKITRTSIGINHKQNNELLPKKANISEFDMNTNLISKITAQTDDIVFEKATLIVGGGRGYI